MFNRLRYIVFGKQIQRQFERAEEAGREASEYAHKGRIKDLENDLEAIKTKHEREVEQIANKKLAEMEYRFNPDDVLTVRYDPMGRPVEMFLGPEKLSNQEISNLKNEARLFMDSRLWKVMTDTLRSQAHEIMFNKSKDFDDMKSGKMMLFNLGVQENIIHTLDKVVLG